MSLEHEVAQVQQPAAERETATAERETGGAGNAAAADVMALENGQPGSGKKKGATTAAPASTASGDSTKATLDEKTLKELVTKGPAATVLITLTGIGVDTKLIAGNIALAKKAAVWDTIVNGLPKGAALDSGTRSALYRAVVHGKLDLAEVKKLFKIRFGHAAEKDTAEWTMDNLLATWKQLDVLPDQDVSKNTVFATFNAISGGGGMYGYSSTTKGTAVQIGQSASAHHLAHTVRHEIGHAVHDQIKGSVNPWLEKEVEFWFYGGSQDNVVTWLKALGEFPKSYKGADGKDATFGEAEAKKVAGLIESWMGSGSWSPTRATPIEGQAADVTAMYNAIPDTMKNGVTQSKANWYSNYTNFQTGAGGRRYFLNHWYHRAYYFGNVAKQAIDATGDDYTAMSEFEFFANCYAEYFKDPAGYTNHDKWGGSLPASVKKFFKNHVLDRNPYKGPEAAPATATGDKKPGEAGAPGMDGGSTGVEGGTASAGSVQGGSAG